MISVAYACEPFWEKAGALPIKEALPSLSTALAEATTVLLEAPPGAGKSTLVPLCLLNAPWLGSQKILMLEPRKIAARAVANRMAQLLGQHVGQTVGYRVRFEARVSAQTRIEVLTEGVLARLLQEDNALEGVGAVLFDEFHERSLQADVALALARECQSVLRPELRLLIMSATLDVAGLSGLLAGSRVVRSRGTLYPVQILYRPASPHTPLHERVAATIQEAFKRDTTGDILAFLPGQAEIEKCRQRLEANQLAAEVLPLYGDLPQEAQQRALMPMAGKRKVILSTSLAETSLTIEGVTVVIDSGQARVPRFDPRSGFTRLETQSISQDAATQRAGRAGRLAPGTCYRLYSEANHGHLPLHRSPEMLEADLAPTLLDLTAWGHADAAGLAWLTPPPPTHITQAQEVLQNLGAVAQQKITSTGKQMLSLPTHPRLAHLLLEGARLGHARLAAQTAAILEERDLLGQQRHTSDITERLEALQNRRGDASLRERINRLAQEWEKRLTKLPGMQTDQISAPFIDPYVVGKLVAAAYPERIARQRQGTSYRLANGRGAKLPDQDPLDREPWLAVATLDAGLAEGKIYLAAPLHPKDIEDLATPHTNLSWDSQAGRIVAQQELRIGPLLLSAKSLVTIPEEHKAKVLCQAIQAQGLSLVGWSHAARQWQLRVATLRAWHLDEAWPDVSEPALLNTIEQWLGPYLGAVRKAEDFARVDSLALAQSLVPWALQQELERRAPTTITVPTGSAITLEYRPDADTPILAVRLQELFGQTDTPIIDGNKPVLLHLLSPAYKPVQITQNLASFWANTYADVRKDLRGRYPKHSWPDNPSEAEPIRGAKKRPPKV